ncbi:MAG: hypothetical protein J6Y30_13725 [Treponema sp.]|nr:hypothetical protein [Treponema sp.]
MNKKIEDAIVGANDVQNGIGHYIRDLLESFGVDAVYEEIEDMLRGSMERFLTAVEFTAFVFANLSYIPGKDDEELIDKMKDLHLFENLIESFSAKRAYSRLYTLFFLLDHIPANFSAERIEELLDRYRVENCILMFPLMKSLTEALGNAFPLEKYSGIRIDDEECNFIVKYLISQSEYLDSFARDEILEKLKGICPQKYASALEKSIAYNKKFMEEDYFGDDEGGDEGWEEIQAVADGYFARVEELELSGESISFTDFVRKMRA